jgi:hypothetical protein
MKKKKAFTRKYSWKYFQLREKIEFNNNDLKARIISLFFPDKKIIIK